MNRSIHSRRGQTLVEALVALSILTTGFVGVVALLNRSFVLNRTTTDDTQATYLASSGIEEVKNLIDHDVYAGLALSSSTNDFGACFPRSGYYYPIDYATTDVSNCSNLSFSTDSSTAATPLYFDPTTHLFSAESSGGTATDFVRYIKVTNVTDATGALIALDVQSTVAWTNGSLSNTITLEDVFYDWQP